MFCVEEVLKYSRRCISASWLIFGCPPFNSYVTSMFLQPEQSWGGTAKFIAWNIPRLSKRVSLLLPYLVPTGTICTISIFTFALFSSMSRILQTGRAKKARQIQNLTCEE
ncbi:unnamed protein product [Ascophyllum nodosum]